MSTQNEHPTATQSLFEKIKKVNAALLALGVEAVQEIKMEDKDGKTIGKIKYGFKPQYVFDAVNEHIGAENWRYEVIGIEQLGKQMIATVDLFIRVGDEWLSKGLQIGYMNVIKDNIADAKKGAITSAIQKGMSLCSIGSDAFKGKLEVIWRAAHPNAGKTPPRQGQGQQQGQQRRQPSPAPEKTPDPSAASSQQPSSNQQSGAQGKSGSQQPAPQASNPTTNGLPVIDGITFVNGDDGFVEAQGDKTVLFEKRQMLSMAGFVLRSKRWTKAIAA